MNPETVIQNAIRAEFGKQSDVVMWRNHTGRIRDEHGVWHAFGLAVGSSDLIGAVSIPVPTTIAATGALARLFVLEVKTTVGRATPEQKNFLRVVRMAGGFGAFVRSVEDAIAALERARKGASE